MTSDFAAIVLAAGSSRRFGADKLFYPVNADTEPIPLIAQTLKPWLDVFEQVCVVVEADDLELQCKVREALGEEAGTRVVWVEASPDDMDGSLRNGIRTNAEAAGWIVGLADMPRLPAQIIAEVKNTLAKGAAIVAPFYLGERGYPLGLSERYRDVLLALGGENSLNHLLHRELEAIVHIETDEPGVLLDIDALGEALHFQRPTGGRPVSRY